MRGFKQYSSDAASLDEKLEKLERRGLAVKDILANRLEKASTQSQRKRVMMLQNYTTARKIQIEIEEPLSQLKKAMDDFCSQVESKNVEETPLRSILSALNAIERQFTQERLELYAEILSIESDEK
jgi:hypothetical protein